MGAAAQLAQRLGFTQNAGSGLVVEGNEEEIRLRQYLRQTGEVASGKRVFLMGGLDIGLAFSTVRDGDIVCILYGCDFLRILEEMEEFNCLEFTLGDIVRSGFVRSYLINKIKLGIGIE